MYRAINIAGFIVLSLLFYFVLKIDGYRLPRYYTPDGIIVTLDDEGKSKNAKRFYEIDGVLPSEAPAVFPTDDPVFVVMDTGIGIMIPQLRSLFDQLMAFKFFIALSFLFFFCAVWFLYSANDLHMAFLGFNTSAFFFLSVAILNAFPLQHLWLISFFSLAPLIFNMSLRLTGKTIGGYFLLAEMIFVIFFALVSFAGQNSIHTNYSLRIFAFYLLLLSALISSLMLLDSAIKRNSDPVKIWKRRAIFSAVFFGLFLPLFYLEFIADWDTSRDIFTIPSLLGFLFPAGLLYGTYRIYLVPFQLIFTRSILAAILTIIFVSVYAGVLLTHSILLPEQEHQWIVNLVFVLILMFFLDPARRIISRFLEIHIFRLGPDLTASLEKIASILSSPIRGQSSLNIFLNELQTVLGVEKVSVLLSDDTFGIVGLKQGKLLRLNKKSILWKHLVPDKIVVTSYLTYGEGSRGSLYRYLVQHGIYMSVGVIGTSHKHRFDIRSSLSINRSRGAGREVSVGEINAAILLGQREGGKKYRLSEIRYLQEAARLGAMMINDYTLLIREIQKRRRMKELTFAADVQRSISALANTVHNVHFATLNIPAISVTGDYLDIFPLPNNRVAGFLGDVSGHGLGTGYLVSTIRSLIRSHMEGGASLAGTINIVNRFLLEKYRGNEFLTLFSFILNTDTGDFEYINAAHPAPFIRVPETGELIHLNGSQRLLGLMEASYRSFFARLELGQRLFLYSDGVSETLNRKDEPIGETTISNYFKDYGGTAPLEFIDSLRNMLDEYRGGATPGDDTTCLILEFNDHGVKESIPALISDRETENE
jgi:protein phosphatase